ncbi:MAG: OsmC family protein [Actinomycetota bacterium]
MSTQRLEWHDGFRFTGTDSWGRPLTIDADMDAEHGSKPADLLPIALAACAAYDVVNILHKQRQDLRGLDATIESEQEPDAPWAFRKISVHYVARGDVDAVKARKALELSESKYCSVSATLRNVVDLSFDIVVEP